jgi:hemerythrin superfamily protein
VTTSQAGQRLVDDHEDLHRLLEQLKEALREKDVDAARSTLDLFWARLAVHIRAEHLRLFPAVINSAERADPAATDSVPPEKAQSVVARLREDHDFFMHELAAAISKTRDLDQVSTIVKAVEERLASHNELEENEIYRWIRQILTEDEQAQLAREIDQELKKRPPRFAASTWPV